MECVECGKTMARVGKGWECPECGIGFFAFDFDYDNFNPDTAMPQRIDANYDFEADTFTPAKWLNLDVEDVDADYWDD